MKPFFEHDGIAIFHGDCREILRTFGLDEARACITDPPYGATSLEWDRWVDEWLAFVPGNTLWCFGTFRMFHDHGFDFDEAEWKLAQDIVWEKHNGSSMQNDRFRRVHELVTHWYRGAWADQLQQVPTTSDATARTVRKKKRPPQWGDIGAGSYESHDGGPRLARSVQRFHSEHGRADHPTPKPVALIRLLLEYSTRPGDLIVDPFCGGGPVLLAAKQLGRRAIGIDIDERWCESSARRLTKELSLTEVAR